MTKRELAVASQSRRLSSDAYDYDFDDDCRRLGLWVSKGGKRIARRSVRAAMKAVQRQEVASAQQEES